jgi:glycosyltransferase involved in cell wall biosynthesis
MRVGLITTSFPRCQDDHRSPFIWEQAFFLKSLGVDIAVLGMHMPGTPVKEIWHGIPIRRPRYLPDRLENLQVDRAGLPSAWNRSLGSRLELLVFLGVHWLACIRLGRQVDILHAHWTISGLAAILSKPFHQKPIILTLHGSDLRLAGRRGWLRNLTRWILENVEAIITVSENLRDQVLKFGIPPNKVTTIPNGIDTQAILPNRGKRENLIVFVGSLTEQKGILPLLEAFDSFHKSRPKCHLMYIGDGKLEDLLRAQIREKQLEAHVSLKGSLPHAETICWISRARLLALPSIDEGFGVVLLEAMACGTPCLGVNSGGVAEIIKPGCGILLPDNKSETIDKALREFFNQPSRQQQYATAARQRVERHYHWPQIARDILTRYRELSG